MRLQLLSDLHLEHNHDFVATPAPGADLLVLAGDIGSCRGGAPAELGTQDFALRRFSPRHGWPTPVLYLPGNHEYDRVDFDAAHARLHEVCDELGILWLERECRVIDGVRFVGTTLWADFDALATPRDSMKQVLDKRGKAYRAADFYLAKAGTLRGGAPFMAEQMREQSLACQAWLRDALARPHDGPTVAVTHFAPTLASADPRYGVTPGTAGFCNSLDELLPQADLWLHGHLHCAFDYVKDGCRVVANPLGYEDKGEQVDFRPHCVIDVAARAPS